MSRAPKNAINGRWQVVQVMAVLAWYIVLSLHSLLLFLSDAFLLLIFHLLERAPSLDGSLFELFQPDSSQNQVLEDTM